MKIIHLQSENIKRIKAVEVRPEGNVVVVTGLNDQGKTSVLDSIEYALGGKDAICQVPIRTGASKAKSVVTLGNKGVTEFKVTRGFSALGGSTLTIEDASGAPVRSPQTLLDKLCQKIAFDPLAFVRMKPAEQLETLRKLVGLDFTALDLKRKTAYDERTIANRELASAKARAAEVEVDPETPDEEVSVADLMAELERINQHNKANNSARDLVASFEGRYTTSKKDHEISLQSVRQLEAALQKAKEDAKSSESFMLAKEKELTEARESAAVLKDKDPDPIRKQINDAGTINAKVRDKKRYKQLMDEVKETEAKVQKLTEEIESFDKQKSDQLSAAKFPLDGLSFDETGVLLNGVPFTQGSQARQLQAAVAIGIAMNPTVRVILCRDASLLDQNSLAMISDMAEKHDMQIWLEVVESKDPAAVVIVDGQVKEEA